MDLTNCLGVGNFKVEKSTFPAAGNEVISPAETPLPFLFEELMIHLAAEAIGLLQYHPGRRDATMLLACGEWQRWNGMQFPIARNQTPFITTAGESHLEHSYLASGRSPLTESSAVMRYLYHLPLADPGPAQTILWIGRVQRWGSKSHLIVGMLNELIGYAMQPESRIDISCDNLPELARRLMQRDPALYEHSLRMLPWIQTVTQAMNFSEYDTQLACWAALLHDTGKAALPRQILDKPGPLTEAEWAVVKLHPGIGARMVPRIKTLTAVREIIHTHHEQYTGLGYPLGLTGDMIPLAARVLAVVDAYAAMTESRPYRPALAPAEAASRIRQEAGRQFDPAVCNAFLSTI